MENAIRECEKAYMNALQVENDQRVLEFLKDQKHWNDANFKSATHKRACAVVCYCQLVLKKKPSLKKIHKCADIINKSLDILDTPEFKARDYLVRLILKGTENSVSILLNNYNLIKQFLPFLSNARKGYEGKLEKKLRFGLKKMIFNVNYKSLIKYLSLAFCLYSNSVLKSPDNQIIKIIAYQFLEFSFKLHDSNKNLENFDSSGNYIHKGIIICKLLELLEDGKDSHGFLNKFIKKISDYNTAELDINEYPFRLKKNFLFKQFNFKENFEWQRSFECISTSVSFKKSFCVLASETIIVKKEYKVDNGNMFDNLKKEFKYYALLNDLNFYSNYGLERFYEYEFSSNNQVIYFLDPFPQSLISLFTTLAKNNSNIQESYLMYLCKNLIKTFSILETNKIHHGNLKPHHLYTNKVNKVVISDFPFLGIVDYDLYYITRPNLLQGVCGYSAPEVPQNYNHSFNYRKHKSDVFSVGLILLQAYYLIPVDSISLSQDLISDYLSNIKYDWLKVLLQQMLLLDFRPRANFRELYSQIKIYKFPSFNN